jgi:hypothetical protein
MQITAYDKGQKVMTNEAAKTSSENNGQSGNTTFVQWVYLDQKVTAA